jgi:hypothetical protein
MLRHSGVTISPPAESGRGPRLRLMAAGASSVGRRRSARHRGESDAGELVASGGDEGGERLSELRPERVALVLGQPAEYQRGRAGRVGCKAHVLVDVAA